MIDKLDHWHKTKPGLAFFVVVELALSYGFISLAIDRGNALYYLLALVFLIGALQNFFKLMASIVRKGKLRG